MSSRPLEASDVPVLVEKFGGSSLDDFEKVKAVAEHIAMKREDGYDLVIVVSAMGDTTDELLEMARSITPSPSRRELDMLLSVGERISMTLLSMAIHAHGLQAISLTGSQCGIITTDSHSNARIMDVRPFRVQDELEKGHIVIVAGYQGTSYRREVTTLGRGGSDTTAVALAAALQAEACEIYSDVDGVYSGDPRVILSASQLDELTHEEMVEMARSGAKVLNEQAVAFARSSGIALYARKAHSPDSRGTVIRPDGFRERARRAEEGARAVAVSHVEDGVFVRAGEAADAVLELLGERDCAICEWDPGRGCELFLETDDIHDLAGLRTELEALGDVEISSAGLVSVVGQGIGGQPRWAVRGRQLLSDADVDTRTVAIGLSRISWVVDAEDTARAANLLHDAFIETPRSD